MSRYRLAAALVAAPLALLFHTGSAHADPIVTGCYGAVVVVCNPTVTVPDLLGTTDVPVCAGTCTHVLVPTPDTAGLDSKACATWTDEAGRPGGVCENPVTVVRAVACVTVHEGC